ncbi:LacI family transcriptional regulator, partial [Blautia producta]
MATIKEIAKACNVSISTVSNILNGKEKARQETKELVLQKAKEMNYVPNYMAKNLKQKNTKPIGII